MEEVKCIIRRSMATEKQKQALDKIVENGGNVTQAMRDVGYAETSVNNPSSLTKSDGYGQLLKDKGLTETLIVESLVSDIKNKPKQRLGELQFGADLIGMKKEIPQEPGSKSTFIENQNVIIIVKDAEDKIRKQLEI